MKITNSLKSLAALAVTAIFAGAAIAGPSNPTASVIPGHRALVASCPMQESVTKSLGVINSKTNTPTRVAIGSKFNGCTGPTVATMTCKGSSVSCSEMVRG